MKGGRRFVAKCCLPVVLHASKKEIDHILSSFKSRPLPAANPFLPQTEIPVQSTGAARSPRIREVGLGLQQIVYAGW